jgi:hypothetical protein
MEFTKLKKKCISYQLMILIATFSFAGCGSGSGSGTSGINSSVISPSTSNSVTLSWIAPTTNEDGTPLTDLAGYKIYYPDMYYFTIVAYDTSGNESNYSNEMGKYIS